MPEPVRNSQRYLPGLDGLRALAVGAVVAYRVHVGWAQGGLLGVGVFFTLSGYLITDLLLGQQERTGQLQLTDFWLRGLRGARPPDCPGAGQSLPGRRERLRHGATGRLPGPLAAPAPPALLSPQVEHR
jgi:hypothetical protein